MNTHDKNHTKISDNWKICCSKVLAHHHFSPLQSRFPQSPVKEPTTNQPLLMTSRFHGFHLLPPSALQAALQLAEEISSFPQQCLRADRSSAIYSSYDAPSFKQVKPHSLCSAILGRDGGEVFWLTTTELPRLSCVIPGDAVRDWPRESHRPGRICRRCKEVHHRSRERRNILIRHPLAQATTLTSSPKSVNTALSTRLYEHKILK